MKNIKTPVLAFFYTFFRSKIHWLVNILDFVTLDTLDVSITLGVENGYKSKTRASARAYD
jgi:hypothetical protein